MLCVPCDWSRMALASLWSSSRGLIVLIILCSYGYGLLTELRNRREELEAVASEAGDAPSTGDDSVPCGVRLSQLRIGYR